MPLSTKAVDLLIQRYRKLEVERSNFDDLYQEIGDYCVPSRNKVRVSRPVGSKTTEKLYDGTAPHALTIASSAVHSSLTPSAIQWFDLQMRDRTLNEEPEVRRWLQACSQAMFDAFNQSNFDAEMQEVGSDLLAFGTACLFVGEVEPKAGGAFEGLRFQAHAPGQYVVSEDADGLVDTVMRVLTMSVGAAAGKWGASKLSETARKHLEDGQPDHELKILHVVAPRTEGAVDRSGGDDVPPKRRPYMSAFIELRGESGQLGHVVQETGFHENPIMVPRWRKLTGEVYGRSPTMNILPTIKTLNLAVKMRLQQWELAIQPPILVRDRGVIGDVRMAPKGITYVRDQQAVTEFLTNARFDVANFSEEQLRAQINAGLYVDQIQLAARPGTPISATEASIRFETMQRILGPTVSRLQAELVAPMINRVFRIMFRRGALPQPPGLVIDALQRGVGGINVAYQGPLARAQRANDVDAWLRFQSVIFPVAQAAPETLAPINFPELAYLFGDILGIPAKALLTREQVAANRQAQVQAEAQQAARQNLVDIAGAAGDAAPLIQALGNQGAPAQ